MLRDYEHRIRPMKIPVLKQSDRGYRFSVDSVILAQMVPVRPITHLVDLGTGNGVLLLLLHENGVSFEKATAIEIQASLIRYAKENLSRYGLSDRVLLLHKDIRELTAEDVQKADVMVCNPPYLSPTMGRIPPNTERAIARHELAGRLEDFLKAGRRFLKPEGSLYLIYPWFRKNELFTRLSDFGWFIRHLDVCYQKEPLKPDFVCLELVLEYRNPPLCTWTRFTHSRAAIETREANSLERELVQPFLCL